MRAHTQLMSVCLSISLCLCAGGYGVSSRSVTSSGGQVKSLNVIESDVDDLSVTVHDMSGVSCNNPTLTTLPNAQLGMYTHTHTQCHSVYLHTVLHG